ncbi:MAG: damage-inducible protein D [Bacteroidia bacterium]
MQTIQLYLPPNEEAFREHARELSLVYYASEAAEEMGFTDIDEFQEAVKRAMELCLHAGIPLDMNFKRIYKCSYSGILYDWKLSVLGYKLVCLNGSAANPHVARMQIDLIRNQALHS